ncbi:putative secreted protein (Por secretion system target) [Neolewinella xylanilytica]|uniref:Putative secreted protein (Por secretion system target) n=1 Tax=Neolewinella xylanilytica TaxID=1514080 RepID=A0A2S6I817_9BACT|nr:T9SS type A sorting domain-containing protein [Neolewinella xylanilytica]PPK87619.1 putative secreted protein (Por secretion system target) [Neolewinella xylanilytica]
MRPFIYLVLLMVCGFHPAHSQETILHFSWDASVTQPDVGPAGLTATTISPYATIAAGGVGGTNGLSAGLRAGGNAANAGDKANIHLVVPAHEAFNVDGIDISLDYQRDEAIGTLISRGANFIFGTAAGAQVTYRLQDPEEGNITTFTSPVYEIDLNDNRFHRLRFVYNPYSGEARLSIDGSVVWTPAFTTPGQTLYWDKTADILIGYDIDGAGNNRPVLDNFTFGKVLPASLPVDLIAFSATSTPAGVALEWETAREENHETFLVQRSVPGGHWKTLATLPGEGDRPYGHRYHYLDPEFAGGTTYYRLAQVDVSGVTTYSEVRSIHHDQAYVAAAFTAYPNPAHDYLYLDIDASPGEIRVSDLSGTDVTDAVIVSPRPSTGLQLDLRTLPAGWYVIHGHWGNRKVLKR